MLQDPDQFIQEKLSKKALSINTVRDVIMAAILVALKTNAPEDDQAAQDEGWVKEKSQEIRKNTSEAFKSDRAPFEYPTISQLKSVVEKLKTIYHFGRLPHQTQDVFEIVCQTLYDKYDEAD